MGGERQKPCAIFLGQPLQHELIEGDFGEVGRSMYYCQIWNRKDGQRWHMHIRLMFDSEGRFYATQPSDSFISTGAEGSTGGSTAAGHLQQSIDRVRQAADLPGAQSRQPVSGGRRGEGRRSPFAGTDGLQ